MSSGVVGQGIGEHGELVAGHAVRDEHSAVGTVVGEGLQCEADKIVTVARDQTAPLMHSPFKLVLIREAFGANLVRADGIDAASPEQLGHPLAEVLIEVKPHVRWPASEGCC